MLFPAFASLGSGAAQLGRARRMERQRTYPQSIPYTGSPSDAALPPRQQDYITPQPRSIYDTGEFATRPPSVTEGTTRHLEINKEGETMTLPKNDL
jgi:hypothetical protein